MRNNESFVIQQDGPNGWQMWGVGGLFAVALIIIALALFNLATWAGWALMIYASGQAVATTCYGVARIVEARGRARALQAARWHVIGQAAREDIEALWGEVGDGA